MAVIELTTQNFNEEVLQSDVPVMVDFWASWCGPCRMVSPIVDEIAEEVQGKAKVGKVNVDEQGDLASQFGVMSIPTIMVFKNGEAVATSVGAEIKSRIACIVRLKNIGKACEKLFLQAFLLAIKFPG